MTERISRRLVLLAGLIAPLRLEARTRVPGIQLLETPAGRTVEVSIWHARGMRRGAIAFSHGAQSAPWKYAPLVEAWSGAGYDVFAPLHVDSTSHPLRAHFQGLASWGARLEDMRAVATMIRDRQYFAAGHSYGGLVSLTLGGAEPMRPKDFEGSMRDVRVRAALAFSPPGPLPGFIDAAGYSHLAVPALIQTGDRDTPPGNMGGTGPDAWRGHLAAFDAAAPGSERYALILPGVDHYFGGLICESNVPGPPQLAQLTEAIAVSKLFLAANGAADREARQRFAARLGAPPAGELKRR